MSSPFAHYNGPSSLPSNYAVFSPYKSQGEPSIPEADTSPQIVQHSNGRQRTRRDSLPADRRPLRPTIGVYPRQNIPDAAGQISYMGVLPSESTPLLSNPPVPRIEEGTYCLDSPNAEPKFKIFWEELVILTKYALPVFAAYILEHSIVVISVVSIGHISTTALAGISLGSMTASVSGFSIIHGLASALDTLLPSAWTSAQPQLVGLWAQRMAVVMFISLTPIYLVWWNAEAMLLLLKQEPEVAHLASIYLRWVSFGLPAYTFNLVSRRYFQSQGLFAVPTRIIVIAAPINAGLNYLLVWGPKPIRLGFIGAPIATAISFNLIALLSISYGVFYAPRKAWHPLSQRMFEGLGVLVRLGLSGVGQTASEWWAWELVALAASLLGPTALATQSILLTSATTTVQVPFALGVATSVRIGNLLGEQKARRAGVVANVATVMALVIACFSSTMFMVFRNSWAYLFNDDPEVVRLVASIMPLLSLFQVFDGASVVAAGILRSIGKQFFGALLNLSAYYIFGIPLGVYLAFTHHMGLHGLWLGLTFSLVYCATIGTWLCLRTDWDLEVFKATKRVEEARKEEQTETEEAQLGA